MRILKYLIFLALLLSIAGIVFVATSDSSYTITRTKYIKSPRSTVFKFVEDYSLWQIWFLGDDSTMEYSLKTLKSKPGLKWSGAAGNGEIYTRSTIRTDSIIQDIDLNGAPAKAYWTFRDTTGGTIATWKIVGTLSFKDKYSAALQGGAEHVVDRMYDRSIGLLAKTITAEVKNYKITIDGLSEFPNTNYLYQEILTAPSELNRNIRVMMTKLEFFADKNKISTSGDPFVIFEYESAAQNLVKIKVCIPIPEEINIVQPSDVFFSRISGYKSVQTTVRGDYSHLVEARTATGNYITKYRLNRDMQTKRVEIYRRRATSEKLPSKWLTEIHTPIGANNAVPKAAQTLKTFNRTPKPSVIDDGEFDL